LNFFSGLHRPSDRQRSKGDTEILRKTTVLAAFALTLWALTQTFAEKKCTETTPADLVNVNLSGNADPRYDP
jgi:hypothetical protein